MGPRQDTTELTSVATVPLGSEASANPAVSSSGVDDAAGVSSRGADACNGVTSSRPERATSAAGASAPTGSSLTAGVSNLLNTIVGGGILSLPFAFKSSGLLVGVFYQILFGLGSWYGGWLLLDALRYRPVDSYEALAKASLGRFGGLAYNLAALVNCYGACVSYIVVIGDIVPPLLHEFGFRPFDDHVALRSSVLIIVTCLVIFPLSALRDISALQYTSGGAIVIYFAFALALLALGLGWSKAPDEPPPPWSPTPLFKPDAGGLIRPMPICAFAFMCQTSLFPIYQEMRNPTPPRIRKVLTSSLVAASTLYVLTGIAAYIRFGEALKGDVLLNLASIDSAAVRFVRLMFGISICLTYPCLHYATRRSLDQLLFKSMDVETPYKRLTALTLGIVGSTLCIGLAVEQVELVFGFTGAIASTMISYILPAAIHLRLRPHRIGDLRRNWGTLAFLGAGLMLGTLGLVNHTMETFGLGSL